MTFVDAVIAWLASVAPIPLILLVLGLGSLLNFISRKLNLRSSRFDDPRF
jgi:hypothetical protein